MVVPLCDREEWLQRLITLPAFIPGDDPVLLISPHPDDETLSCGGLVARQRQREIPVRVVAITDGERAYEDIAGLAELRTREQIMAAQRLGVASSDIVRFHLRDSNVAAQSQILFDRLLPLIETQTHIVAPWPHDFHPDHEACGKVAHELSQRTGARLTFYFFWTWHRGTPDMLDDLQLCSLPLTPDVQQAKSEALAYHSSQLHHVSGDPVLHDIHLWPARLPFEIYLPV